jgi:aryl-alcohol dehydrogenase (NADP+)
MVTGGGIAGLNAALAAARLGADVVLTDDLLDAIDAIVPHGTVIAPLDGAAYVPPPLARPSLRRRPVAERAAA